MRTDKNANLNIRVSEREARSFRRAAEKAGFTSTSEWIRQTLKKETERIDNVRT
jgi:predicted HicB family RNase H-like nuclease